MGHNVMGRNMIYYDRIYRILRCTKRNKIITFEHRYNKIYNINVC